MKLYHSDPDPWLTASLFLGMVLGTLCALGGVWLLVVLMLSFEWMVP